MKQVFDQLLRFLHEGIAAIFHFVELIWTWSVDQITRLMAVPWQDWPIWKQILLVLIIAAVAWALYRAGMELLAAGAAILASFARLLGALVQRCPTSSWRASSRSAAYGSSTTWTIRRCGCRIGCRRAASKTARRHTTNKATRRQTTNKAVRHRITKAAFLKAARLRTISPHAAKSRDRRSIRAWPRACSRPGSVYCWQLQK